MSTHFIEKIEDERLPERFAPLQVTPLMPNFGARISGVDLISDLTPEIRALLRKAWSTYGVVIFTGQRKFSTDQHMDVAHIFGTPDFGSRIITKLTPQVDVIVTDSARPPVTNLWHSDNTTLEHPSIGTIIQIQDCPPVGGNTGWVSTAKAYRCLSVPMKKYLEGLSAVHYWDNRGHRHPSYLNEDWDNETYFKVLAENPPRTWPIVRTHPLTGEESLYVNEGYTNYIVGVHRHESIAILSFLYNWMRTPEFYVTHTWAPNDVAVWDNFSMQHYGLADYTDYRVNQRVTFIEEGKQPV